MLLLGKTDHLGSASDVQSALSNGLGACLTAPAGNLQIVVQGQMPVLDLVRLDLSSATVDPSALVMPPVQPVDRREHFGVARFQLLARPLFCGSATLTELIVEARETELEVVTDARNRRWLALARAAQGSFTLDLEAGELERLLLDGIRHAAARHGVGLEGGSLRLAQMGERAIGLELEASGRKAFLRGTVVLTGELRLDESLSAQVTRLTCSGRGALGSLVASLLKSSLRELENRTFSLPGHTLDAVTCRQMRMVVGLGNALRVDAAFGA